MVLSRAGYSTIMDLLKLGKRAILVPTPGQTEQEYLGHYLSGKQMALCIEQSAFSLPGAMAIAWDFPFAVTQPAGNDLLQKEIRSFLETLESHKLESHNPLT
jgi:predicted glycosyltransferase